MNRDKHDDRADRDIASIHALVERIRPLLAGQPPLVQAASLADLVAIWLAGHDVPGDKNQTDALRAKLLAQHCDLVRQLVPLNTKQAGTTP